MSEGTFSEDILPTLERDAVVPPIEIPDPEALSKLIEGGYTGSILVAEGSPYLSEDQVPVTLLVRPRNSRNERERTVDLEAEVRMSSPLAGETMRDRESILFGVVGAMHQGESPLVPNAKNRYVVTGPTGEKIQVGLNDKADNRGDFSVMMRTGHQGHSPKNVDVVRTIATLVNGIDTAREASVKNTGQRNVRYTVAIPASPSA